MKSQANRQEAAIARTPKTTSEASTGTRRPAAKAKTPAAKPARPAAKASSKATTKATAKPKAAAEAAPKAAPKAAAKPKAAPKAAPKSAAKAAPKVTAKAKPAAKKAAATPQLKASAAAAARRAAAPAAGAPPRPSRRARAPKVAPALLDRLVAAARKSLEDDKAENLVVLDVTGRADYADRLVIATGLADRQIQAMATHLEDAFEKAGLKLRRDAIQASPDWVLIDAGDLVVHLFKPEARGLYGLERMWGPDSPAPDQDRTPLPDDGGGGSTATEDDDE